MQCLFVSVLAQCSDIHGHRARKAANFVKWIIGCLSVPMTSCTACLYADLQCQCVRCHKKVAIFRCMPLDSKHSTSRTTRLLNSAYYSRESLELLQFFILQHSPPLLPQSPQIIIISRTLLDAHTTINKSWPEIGADNSSAPADQIVKSFQKRKPIGDIPILKLYNIQSPNWGTRSTLFPLCIYPIPFMSLQQL